jgi:bifunctional UDP-N-acetylglucosamine pyrophosphorylase/glucosamine-1-phosphate N-acetyltransferase
MASSGEVRDDARAEYRPLPHREGAEPRMTQNTLAVVILAAGKGTRMKSDLPKVLHPLAGRPLLHHVQACARALDPARSVVVIGPGMEQVAAAARPTETAIQHHQRGTADAVGAARPALAGFDGDVLVLYGDTPLLRAATLDALLAARREAGAAVAVLGFAPADPAGYGRIVLEADGQVGAIVEHNDASDAIRAIGLCNSGVMAFDGRLLFDLIDAIGSDNAKGEFYLTDAVAEARRRGLPVVLSHAEADEVLGVNSRVDLAEAEACFQARARRAAMEAGVTLADPASVYFSFDTRLGRDVEIGQNVVFGPGVTVADRVAIRPFCHIEGAAIAEGAVVGPFARLRPGARIGPDAHIGNFVEVKQAEIEGGAKVNHLSYIGDARVGARANVGAGTITCNYDGFGKHRTEIGEGAFIGSNTCLVAPVRIGDGAYTGSGSVITEDLAPGALGLTRAPLVAVAGWAERFRRRKTGER